jgi:hypothetical protein
MFKNWLILCIIFFRHFSLKQIQLFIPWHCYTAHARGTLTDAASEESAIEVPKKILHSWLVCVVDEDPAVLQIVARPQYSGVVPLLTKSIVTTHEIPRLQQESV